jgi:hypothetical protein
MKTDKTSAKFQFTKFGERKSKTNRFCQKPTGFLIYRAGFDKKNSIFKRKNGNRLILLKTDGSLEKPMVFFHKCQ